MTKDHAEGYMGVPHFAVIYRQISAAFTLTMRTISGPRVFWVGIRNKIGNLKIPSFEEFLTH